MSSVIKVITGMSGAGKTHAIQIMEDLDYFCVDNLPPELFPKFVEMAVQANIEKIAFVTDIRGQKFFPELQTALKELKGAHENCTIIFLEASDAVLVRRFKETRRRHPVNHDGNVVEGIAFERQKLQAIKAVSDIVIDTSSTKVKAFREILIETVEKREADSMKISLFSFGFKYGLPIDADLVMDVRFLPNPFYLEELKPLTGLDAPVRDYVMSFDLANNFVRDYSGLVLSLLDAYKKEGKNFLSIAIGCTGGQHRSVVMTEEIARVLEENNDGSFTLKINHRDKPEVDER